MNTTRATVFDAAYNEFFQNTQVVESAILSATHTSFGGGKYYIEFFDDGTYRELPESQIGNFYDSPGLLISVPALSEDEYDLEDESNSFFNNAVDAFAEKFEAILKDRELI